MVKNCFFDFTVFRNFMILSIPEVGRVTLGGQVEARLRDLDDLREGRTGRAFMRALSERQYSASKSVFLNEPIEAALRGWLRILMYGQPRPILKRVGGPPTP